MIASPGLLRYGRVLAGVVAVISLTVFPDSASAAVPHPTPVPAIAEVSPAAGDVVGVGNPVEITFVRPVADRGEVERSIRVVTPRATTGQFEWLSTDTVRFTPDQFWPAHSTITVLAGDLPLSFDTGSSVVGVADISAHTFTVSVDGVVAREMPASMGKPGFASPVGSFTALAKERDVVMDSRTIGIPLDSPEGYKLDVTDAVRVTWGGVYVHSAPWSVGSQGYANVSHGCINLSPDNAAWYYDMVSIGDPIVITS
jgi:lipoprotein-anchoring transpeptidase ErfK/SrfK